MAEILLVDDQDRYAELVRRAIPHHRYHGPARSLRDALDWLSRRERVDLVLLDVHFDIAEEALAGWVPGMDRASVERLKRRQGLEILAALRGRYPELPVILMTSRQELDLEEPAAALHAEEYTYLLDDDQVDARSLAAQIDGIVRVRRSESSDGPVFWGASLGMRRLRQRLEVLARGRLPVVLLGPTGTGKSLLARHFVHARSGRTGRFVAVDLATLPQDLVAAHLFGSVKGSYTGSVADRVGAFELAHQGTLFLDEVGNLGPDAQKLLLTVLQEGVVTRIGDLKEREVDVKVVAATNDDLAARVAAGTFRADLFMRLNPATAIRLPSLAERRGEIDELLRFSLGQALARPYLQELVAAYRTAQGLGSGPVDVVCRGPVPPASADRLVLLFPDRSMRLLRDHPWPGNLRELAMAAENAAVFALSEVLGVRGGDRRDVVQIRPKMIRDLLLAAPSAAGDDGEGRRITVRLEPHDTLNKVAQACERQYFEQLYLETRGDFGQMAGILLGDPQDGRKVQLRLNQLGLKVRDLKARLR